MPNPPLLGNLGVGVQISHTRIVLPTTISRKTVNRFCVFNNEAAVKHLPRKKRKKKPTVCHRQVSRRETALQTSSLEEANAR